MTRILIVGGIAAGMKAAATARRRKPDLDILVLQDEAEVSYSACGLPFSLGDSAAIPRAALIARSVERFRADGVDLRVRHRVEEVDISARRARIRSLDSDAISVEPFDQILFATGAQAIAPRIPTTEGAPPMLPLRSLADADRLRDHFKPGGRAVIIGGGYIGLEMAEALRLQGQAVTLVEAAPRLLPAFDPAIGEAVAAHLARHGVTTHLGVSVAETVPGGVTLADGRFIEADLALAAIGVRPRVELAAAAGVAIGETGAIAVDEAMRTNLAGVYAAGDCAEARHVVSGKAVWYPLGDIANRQGRVAGLNIAGGQSSFPGVLGTAIFKVFDLAVARTGLTPEQARQSGFDPIVVRAKAPSRARYMPNSRSIDAALVVDRRSGRLLGAEAIGPDGVDKYIDVVATAIWARLAADDLADLDLAYAPPFSPVFAAAQVIGELARKECGVLPGE
ncbi:MAG: FAD-dependent oxidoreductase [Roseiarcus sp.]|jgi:NADPH-dependent 2,4-dienoyl-CoA reductase/sulfur reductase-like enzyme